MGEPWTSRTDEAHGLRRRACYGRPGAGVLCRTAQAQAKGDVDMTLDDFIKEHPMLPVYREWAERIWQAAHAEGEKVGVERGMRLAAGVVGPFSKELILKAIDARKDK